MSEQKTFLPALQSPLFADVMRMPSDNDALYSVTREQALLTVKSAVETDKQLWVYAKAGITKEERAKSKENLEVALSHLISNLQESLNPKNKMSPKQIGEAAIFFAVEFQDLTFKEIVFAFREFKLGRYIEKNYGDLNIKILSSALRAYKIGDDRMELFEGRTKFFREAPTEKADPALIKEKVAEILGNIDRGPVVPRPVVSSEPDLAPFRKTLSELRDKPEMLQDLIIFSGQAAFLKAELVSKIKEIGVTNTIVVASVIHFMFQGTQYRLDSIKTKVAFKEAAEVMEFPEYWEKASDK